MALTENDVSSLVERINHAALDPSGWADVLHRLAAATDCIAGGLTIENPSDGTGDPIDYFGFDADHVARTWHHYLPMNPLFAIGSRLQPGVIVANGMVCPIATFTKTEFYDGWARPQGLCCPITLVLHRSGGAYIPLTLVRPDGRGDAGPDDFRLLAHVAPVLERAFAVTLRLDRLGNRDLGLSEAARNAALGLLLLEADGRIAFVDEIAQTLLLRADILGTSGVIANLAKIPPLQAAVSAAQGPNGLISDVMIPRQGQVPLLLTAVPVTRGVAFDGGAARVTCAIVVGDVRLDQPRPARRIGMRRLG